MATVRVTFDDATYEKMKENAPAALQDPEVVRHYVSLGMVFVDARLEDFSPSDMPVDESSPESDDHTDSQ